MPTTIDRPQIELAAVDLTKQAFDSVKKNFAGLRESVVSFKGVIGAGVIGLAIKEIADGVKGVANYGEALAKSSEKTGIAVESYARLQYAAHLADVENEALAKGLKGLAGNVYENDKAFSALGVSTRNSSGQIRGMEEILGDVADAFAGMEDGAGKSALATRLFGKAGAELIPLLNQGRQGLKDAGDEAQRFGLVIGGDAARNAQEFNDNLKRLEAVAKGAKTALGNDLIPALNDVLAQLLKGRELFGSWSSAIYNLGTINPFRDVADNIKRLNAELADLEKRKALFKDFGEQAPASLDREIEVTRKRIEFLKLQQRQNVAQIDDPSLDEGARLRARFGDQTPKKKPAPNLPDTDAIKRQADLYSAALKNAEDMVRKTQDLTRAQEMMQRIDAGYYGRLLPDQRATLINLAAIADQNAENAQTQKEADEAVRKSQAESADRVQREAAALQATADAYKDLADPTAKYVRQIEEINRLREKGLLTADQAVEAEFKIQEQIDATLGKTAEAVKENDKLFTELGLTFTSALGKLFTGAGDGSNFIKALTQDVIQLIAKIAILEPLAQNIRDLFKNSEAASSVKSFFGDLFGPGRAAPSGGGATPLDFIPARATGGPVTGGGTYLVGERGPELFTPGTSGSILPNSALRGGAGGGRWGDINITFAGGAPTDPQTFLAQVMPVLQSVSRGAARNEIATQLRPGGVLAG